MSGERKKRIFDIIQIGYDEDWGSRLFDIVLMILILTNLFIAVYTTFDSSEYSKMPFPASGGRYPRF